ncbi:Gfo/Idh/MocA family oxidoreductase, partial [Acinetobacter baumannii]
VKTRNNFPNAKYYKDFREMLDKEHKNIDAVSVSTPDHMHAPQALAAMQLNKHVYVQKPLTHDIYEARMLTKAAHEYKVVTQMGNQGASGDG